MCTLRLGDIPPLRRGRAAPPPRCKLPAYAGPSLIPLTLVVLGKSYRDSLWLRTAEQKMKSLSGGHSVASERAGDGRGAGGAEDLKG